MQLSLIPQPWDSQQLHLRAAALACDHFQQMEALAPSALRDALFHAINGVEADMIMAKIDHDAPGMLTALLSVGGSYIGTECRFAHVNTPDAPSPPTPAPAPAPGVEVRFVSRCDPLPFFELAQDMRHSRFALDPRLDQDAVRQLWRTSIANHCAGLAQELAVLCVNDTPAGLVALGIDAAAASVQLKIVGLRRAYRGQGLGRTLLNAIIRRHAPTSALAVEAFSTNAAALRAYQGCGFQLRSICHVVHWWPTGTLPRAEAFNP